MIAHSVAARAFLGHRNGSVADDTTLKRICGGRGLHAMSRHEAAHAIAALACGVDVQSVRLGLPFPLTEYVITSWPDSRYVQGVVPAAGYLSDVLQGLAEAHVNVPKRDAAQDTVQMKSAALKIVKCLPAEVGGLHDASAEERALMRALLEGFCETARTVLAANESGWRALSEALASAQHLSTADIRKHAGALRTFTPAEVEHLVLERAAQGVAQ